MSSSFNNTPEAPKEFSKTVARGRFPQWLHRKLPQGNNLWETQKILKTHRLPTVCEEAKCPNHLECWSQKTATFLAMGKQCTRSCSFCDIDFNVQPSPLDPLEPLRLAQSVKALKLRHVVITMVARDDLPDGGAQHLVQIMQETKKQNPHVTIEVLTSDFQENYDALRTVLQAKPEIFNHNIETVEPLSKRVRHKATYRRTLALLRFAKENSNIYIKSGFMVGLGETKTQVYQTLQDLKNVGCHIVTIGQYLQPNRRKRKVADFIPPETFKEYTEYADQIGLPYVHAGPFVRSSYNASSLFQAITKENHE